MPIIDAEHPRRLPGRYILRFSDGVDVREMVAELESRHGAKTYGVLNRLRGFWGEVPESSIEKLRTDLRIRRIEADGLASLTGVGDTVQSSPLQSLDRMDQRTDSLDNKYEYSATGYGTHIWIVDNGINQYDSDISGRVGTSFSFSTVSQDPHSICSSTDPKGDHGNKMAQFAAGTTLGVAKRATVYSARGNELSSCSDFSWGGLSYLIDQIVTYSPRPAVISVSIRRTCIPILGCGTTIDDALEDAVSAGITAVVTAANDASDACDFSPSHVAVALTVAAADPASDSALAVSNYGSCVDLYAPANPSGGTSQATAHTAGVAALFLQFYPSANPATVSAAILNKATTGALHGVPSGTPNKLLYSKPPTLIAAIPGETSLGPSTYCSWSVDLQGGQPPYTFLWKRDGTPVSTGMDYSVGPAGSTGFGLDLLVTDGVGRTTTAMKSISIDPMDYRFTC